MNSMNFKKMSLVFSKTTSIFCKGNVNVENRIDMNIKFLFAIIKFVAYFECLQLNEEGDIYK